MNQEIADNSIRAIKELYELGDGGRYEIIKRSMFIIDNALILGKTSKECVDRLMDLGTKHLELGIAICVSLTRADPDILCEVDQKLQLIYIKEHKDMISSFEILEKQSGD